MTVPSGSFRRPESWAHPLHALAAQLAPEAVVYPLHGTGHESAQRDGRPLDGPHGHGTPPDVRLGVGADRHTRHADVPVVHDVGPQPVAGLPVDLVLLDPVDDRLALGGDAVGGAGVRALATDLAEILDADVDGLVGHERQVGQDGVAEVHARAEPLGDEHAVPADLAEPRPERHRHGGRHARRHAVAELPDVTREVRVNGAERLSAQVVGRVADAVPVRTPHLVVPRVDAGDSVREALRGLLGTHHNRAAGAVGAPAVVGVAPLLVEERRVDAHDADFRRAQVLRDALDVLGHHLRVGDLGALRVDLPARGPGDVRFDGVAPVGRRVGRRDAPEAGRGTSG